MRHLCNDDNEDDDDVDVNKTTGINFTAVKRKNLRHIRLSVP